MLYNYNQYCLLERNLIKKIKKFANIPEIYDWAHEMDENLSLWIADKLVKKMRTILSGSIPDIFKLTTISAEERKTYLENALKHGKKNITDKEWDDINRAIITAKSKIREKITKVLHYVNSPLHEIKPNITKLSLEEAIELTNKWHKEIEAGDTKKIEDETGEIIMTFPDGFYWIDTLTTKCSAEAEAMGHCGNTNKGTTILSLRKNKHPHVTVAWDENDNVTTQIKGKGNKKPIERYHPYIVDLICKLGCIKHKSEYSRTTDFLPEDLSEELLDKLKECNPDYVENTKPMDIDELKHRYKEDILYDIDEYIQMYTSLFWRHIDDDKYIDDFKEGELGYYKDDFNHYFDEDQLKEWLKNNIPNNLKEWLIENDENNGLDEEGSIKDIDDLIDEYHDIYHLFDHFNLIEDICQDEVNDRFDSMSAEDVHNEFYGSGNFEKGEIQHLLQYFDEDAFADEIVDGEDDDYLRERYDE